MRLGMVGLGRMGAGMAGRLLAAGHEVVGSDRDSAAVQALAARGAVGAASLEEVPRALGSPRAIWLMVPAGAVVDTVLAQLAPLLEPGDVLVDGGNSNFHDSQRRARELSERGLHLVDVGTSGGIWGPEGGYCLMAGGEARAVELLAPAFDALAPAPGRGWGHVGPSGAGHYTKMVHNAIEYGLMQAYAEGFALLDRKRELELDLAQIAELWGHGSVVRSWLLELIGKALAEPGGLSGVAPYVEDSGMGRWAVAEAIELDVPASVMTQALIARLSSREENSLAHRLLAALRNQFGGHAMRRTDEAGQESP